MTRLPVAVAAALLCVTALPRPLPAQDALAAGFYVQAAEAAMRGGRWDEALAVLERGADFAAVSSDLSYLLALARERQGRPRGDVLEALNQALETGRWTTRLPEDARVLKARHLLALTRWGEARETLAGLDSPEAARLRLRALRHTPGGAESFRRLAAETLDRQPRDPVPAGLLLDFFQSERAAGRFPQDSDLDLLALVLKRLPVLLPQDPGLAWQAAPFVADVDEARRLVAAYRASGGSEPGAIPVALDLGVVSGETAVDDLFGDDAPDPALDRDVLERVYDLLRDDAQRERFTKRLEGWTGRVVQDVNHDGLHESTARYARGLLVSYHYDVDQDGLPEITLAFDAGDPRSAVIALTRPPVALVWEENRYPAVREAVLAGETYTPRPFDFFYAPVRFRGLPGGLLFPEADPRAPALTRRLLAAEAIRLTRPSAEFPGGVEELELAASVPVRAQEYLDGRLVSETDFLRGRPLSQRVDLDLDGRLETVRHFRRGAPGGDALDYERDIDYVNSDWDGDGRYE